MKNKMNTDNEIYNVTERHSIRVEIETLLAGNEFFSLLSAIGEMFRTARRITVYGYLFDTF